LSSFQIIQTLFPFNPLGFSLPRPVAIADHGPARAAACSGPVDVQLATAQHPTRRSPPAAPGLVGPKRLRPFPRSPAPQRLTGGARLSSSPRSRPRAGLGRVRCAAARVCLQHAWLPWPAHRGQSPGLFKMRRHPLNPLPETLAAAFYTVALHRNPSASAAVASRRRRRFAVEEEPRRRARR
jgi:hypothetical protein